MSRINTVPKGLQSFLGNTNFGDNPSEMSEVAAPIVDLNPFLQVDQVRAYESAVITQNAPPVLINSLTVPENELWFILAAAVSVNCVNATQQSFGSSLRLRFYPNNPNSAANPQVPLLQLNGTSELMNREIFIVDHPPQPFPVPGSCAVDWVFDTEEAAGDSWDWRTYLWYYALQA